MPVPSNILDNIANTIKDKNERVAHGIIHLYGDNGAGKTVLAMTLAQAITPPDKRILVIDTSNGWISLDNHPELDRDRYDVMPFINREQVMAVAEGIETSHVRFAQYGCLMLDEFSTIADEDLLGLVEKRANVDKSKDPDEPTWPDRNATDNRIKKLLASIIGPYHLICVSHERQYKNKQKQSCTGPDFADALRVKTARPMHFIGHVEAALIEGSDATAEVMYRRYVQCHASQFVSAKSRISGLKVHEDFPSLVRKITKWLESGGKLIEPQEQVTLPTETASESNLLD